MAILNYDYVVIGSSPLLLIEALKFADNDKRVLLIEENEDLGGSWKLIKLPNGSVIEDACHLLEWYHRGYDVLAKRTGCKFVPMDPSPQQLNRSGKLVPYLSRSEIVKSMFLNTFGLCISIIRLMFPGKRTRAARMEIFTDVFQNYKFLLVHRFIRVLSFQNIMAPSLGFEDFIEKLIYSVSCHQNIDICYDTVRLAVFDEEHVSIKTRQRSFKAYQLVMGDSSNIELQISGVALDLSVTKNYNYHVLVALPEKEIINDISYIQLPFHSDVHRITKIRKGILPDQSLFLVQLRRDPLTITDLTVCFRSVFQTCKIINDNPNTEFNILKMIRNAYATGIRPDYSLKEHPGLCKLNTFGDLTKNILLNE